MAQTRKNIGDILVDEGVLSRDEFEEVVKKSKARKLTLEETLFRLGYISRDRLGSLFAKLYESEFIDLYSCKIDEQAVRAVPAEIAMKLRALPYSLDGETLMVTLACPFEKASLDEIVRDLAQASGKEVRVVFCNPEPLNEMLLKHYKAEKKGGPAERGDLASIISSIKSEDVGVRGRFEELYDIGQTALIGARSHPFSQAVAASMEEARNKLLDSKKYIDSGFQEEAVQMAADAVNLLREATARADAIERDWERLVQQVKNFRAKVTALEDAGASEYAPSEFEELSEIRDSLLECVNERNVDGLRSLLDQGMLISERVGLLSPDRNRGREQVMASLSQVREVIARARKAGAKDHAPDVLNEAYAYLDRAEACARRSRWDDVRDCLAAAESKAVEAEGIAQRASDEKRKLTIRLRQTVRDATSALEEAMARTFAHELMEDLMRAKDMIGEAKSCFESGDHERGISLAEETARSIREGLTARIDRAEKDWNELFRKANEASAKIRSVDISLGLKLVPEKTELLFQAERDMVSSLCERSRERLADSVSKCEDLLIEVINGIEPVKDVLQQAEDMLSNVAALLASAAASGVDEQVAPAYVEARGLLEKAREYAARGSAGEALYNAEKAREKIQTEVIQRQESARNRWLKLLSSSKDLFEEIEAACSPDASHYCPALVGALRSTACELNAAVFAHDPSKAEACLATIKDDLRSITGSVAAARAEYHETVSKQLGQIEEAVRTAVERCSGYYAPDMLEDVYLDLKRISEAIASGPDALNAELARRLDRDIAVARTKVWQVEFLRERFEREREENLRQLRLKMDSAREDIEACARLDFVGEDSDLVRKARGLLEQADNLLIEGDIEGSFELVRQSHAIPEALQAESRETENRWKKLVESLTSEEAPQRAIILNPEARRIAGEQYQRLSELSERTQTLIESKDLGALTDHAESLKKLCAAIAESIEESERESRRAIEQKMREAQHESRLALFLGAEDFCPDVINAARRYLEVAQKYLEGADFENADSAASDALAKARDASTQSKAACERAGTLALDYMKIAAAQIEQDQTEGAGESLRRGISLAELARGPSEKPAPPQIE